MSRLFRRRRFINDRLQFKLLAVNLGYLTAIIFFFLAAVFAPLIVTLYTDPSAEVAAQAGTEFLSLHEGIWPAIPLALVLIAIHSILISHRIAGPLFRFRKVFASVRGGDLSVRAGVRKNDYLGRDADAINEMIDGLVAGLAGVDHALARLQQDVARLRAAPMGGALDDVGRSLDELETRVKSFRLPAGAGADRSPAPDAPEPAMAGSPPGLTARR